MSLGFGSRCDAAGRLGASIEVEPDAAGDGPAVRRPRHCVRTVQPGARKRRRGSGLEYHYDFWRPETAIRAGDTDGNRKTDPDTTFAPFIVTPCFSSYPSHHASGSYGGAELLTRIYGPGGHSITLSNAALGLTLQYTRFSQITNDVDDARVYGGIHFRFEQEAGARLGRAVGGQIYRDKLRPKPEHDR